MESIKGPRRQLGERVGPIKAIQIGRSKIGEQMRLYDPDEWEEEGPKYVAWVKQYLRLYKAMFHKYSAISKNKGGIKKNTFDDLHNQRSIMNLFEIITFLNDF
jgi:hypothetical protein